MSTDALYSFWARGFLAEQTLMEFKAGALAPDEEERVSRIRRALPLEDMDSGRILQARTMSTVYTAIAAFENTVRDYLADVLLEAAGANWWEERAATGMKEKAKSRIEEEERLRYHTPRGGRPIDYIDFGELSSLIAKNWPDFESYLPSQEWVKSLFEVLENSRNIIMHSGTLDPIDVERVGIHIRDWIQQVGA